MLRHIEPQAPLLGGAHVDILQDWDSPILSASDGTGEKCATTNDNDAIEADVNARACDAELLPWLSWSRIVHHTFHFASDTEAEMLS